MSEVQTIVDNIHNNVETANATAQANLDKTAQTVKSSKQQVSQIQNSLKEQADSAELPSLQSSQSAFVQHLATYPAVTALAGLVASFPVAKIFVSNAVPLLHAIHDRTRPVSDPVLRAAEPALKRADQLGDQVLSGIDSRFPQVKTVHPSDVYEDAQQRIVSARQAAQSQVDQRLVQPVSNAASAAKEQYIKVFDQQGRYVTSVLNSSIAPINNRLEGVLQEYLPAEKLSEKAAGAAEKAAAKADVSSGSGSELQRSYSLVKTAAERAQPKFQKAQASSREHIVSVYRQKLAERSPEDSKPSLFSSALALASAGKQLTGEGIASCAHLASLTGQALRKQQ